MMIIAHTRNQQGQRQPLKEHLEHVAQLAAMFADPFNAGALARYAGLIHDIGKYNPAFQKYLLDAEVGISGHHIDHKAAGAILAMEMGLQPLSFLVKGHHGGLPSQTELASWLARERERPDVREAIEAAKSVIPTLKQMPGDILPGWVQNQHEVEMFIRMLFSCLIDSDFLDTEAHFTVWKSVKRNGSPSLAMMLDLFLDNQHAKMQGADDTLVNQVRAEVYQYCQASAEERPGFFRLTVPTGGGKTRSSLGFALKHASWHGKQRIIYAIPYISITDQIASEFRCIFPAGVLEHHSGAVPPDPDLPNPRQMWARLAAENWDAPLVVTTTVQLFESLLACSTSKCRKLHNIANSIIVLDEVQMLPTALLTPLLDVLRQLVAHYGTTVLLCTATQPALHDRDGFQGLSGIREIIPDAGRLFDLLKRVEYQWPRDRWTWEQVAARMQQEHQCLCICNLKRDAHALLNALGDDPTVLHLSTNLCGKHRSEVLAEVKRRLATGEPCRLISTQVVEAGVDLDFALVLRAIGPLDRITQAGGRCNREGKLPRGQVVVFVPSSGSLPPGPYRIGTMITQDMLQRYGSIDLDDPGVYQHYFQALYSKILLDSHNIQSLRASLDYPETAKRTHLIEDQTEPVVVEYDEQAKHLISQLQQAQGAQIRQLMRQIQPYIVNLRARKLEKAIRQGNAVELVPGLWQWMGIYDQTQGITGIHS